jgi:cytochrome c oxidase subunit 2
MLTELGLLPEAASTVAGRVDALYFFLIAVSVLFGLGIALTLVRFGVKYRRRRPDEEAQVQIEGSLLLEAIWTLIPLAIAMSIFVWSANVYLAIARPPDDALEIFVVGKQWMWKLQHMEGRREINELHVPVGRPIKLTMTSEDVIHSFYVPAFRVKADAVPGRYTTIWFEATKPGRYHLFCAEYCGTDHSRMIGRIIAVEPADYQAWLAGKTGVVGAAAQDSTPVAELGRVLFEKAGCPTCHAIAPGTAAAAKIGPPLYGVFEHLVELSDGRRIRADAAYIRESILDPTAKIAAGYQPMMPTYQGRLSEEDVMRLVAYIKSLGGAAGKDS